MQGDYKKNVQARSAYVVARNIECYKSHNYGHIGNDCRSMIDTSMKENTDIIYKKVWIRKQGDQVNKDQVPEIAILAIKWDEQNSTEKRKDVRYRKVWKIIERKEGQVNKEQVQEIVLSGIVVKDESIDRKKEFKAQRDNESTHEDDDESTNEADDEYTSEQELFWAIQIRDSQVIWILDRGSLCDSCDRPKNHPSSSLQSLSR